MKRHRLVIARNVLKPEEIKFFLSNARATTKLDDLLLGGFSWWRVERCLEDSKQEVGLDHYEGRCYTGLKRHLAISAVSYLFLAQVQVAWSGKKSGGNDRAGADGPGTHGATVVVGRTRFDEIFESIVKRIQDQQRDAAKARRSQIKRTRRKLREIGILLTKVHRCRWDTS